MKINKSKNKRKKKNKAESMRSVENNHKKKDVVKKERYYSISKWRSEKL